MQDVLNLLLELQIIDEDMGELDRSKVYLPEMIANINNEIIALKPKSPKTSRSFWTPQTAKRNRNRYRNR
jgi:hypothetical protein